MNNEWEYLKVDDLPNKFFSGKYQVEIFDKSPSSKNKDWYPCQEYKSYDWMKVMELLLNKWHSLRYREDS